MLRKRIFRGSDPRALVRELTGSRLTSSTARGKQMVFQFSRGSWLGIHLGMSGALRMEPVGFRPEKHDHLVLQQAKARAGLSRSTVIRSSEVSPWEDATGLVEHRGAGDRLGGIQRVYMADFLKRHARAAIKGVLLMQAGFPGVGNWMADEILWRAQVAPATRSGELTAKHQAAVRRATRFVSRQAMRIIGNDFADPPRSWLIHQRWKPGGSCPRDGTTLSRATIGGRTTAWCSKCQPSLTR
jgi:formamidopyrimidine-DNA glycosylase